MKSTKKSDITFLLFATTGCELKLLIDIDILNMRTKKK